MTVLHIQHNVIPTSTVDTNSLIKCPMLHPQLKINPLFHLQHVWKIHKRDNCQADFEAGAGWI